jgi:hypothetical protein
MKNDTKLRENFSTLSYCLDLTSLSTNIKQTKKEASFYSVVVDKFQRVIDIKQLNYKDQFQRLFHYSTTKIKCQISNNHR